MLIHVLNTYFFTKYHNYTKVIILFKFMISKVVNLYLILEILICFNAIDVCLM